MDHLLPLAAGDWTGSGALHIAGGYAGLLTAALAFYLSAADVINEVYQRAVLPIGAARSLPQERVPEAVPQPV